MDNKLHPYRFGRAPGSVPVQDLLGRAGVGPSIRRDRMHMGMTGPTALMTLPVGDSSGRSPVAVPSLQSAANCAPPRTLLRSRRPTSDPRVLSGAVRPRCCGAPVAGRPPPGRHTMHSPATDRLTGIAARPATGHRSFPARARPMSRPSAGACSSRARRAGKTSWPWRDSRLRITSGRCRAALPGRGLTHPEGAFSRGRPDPSR